MRSKSSRGAGIVMALCVAAGIFVIASPRSLDPLRALTPRTSKVSDDGEVTEEFGERLISRTTEYLGPDVKDPNKRSMNSRLACASCHIGAGAEPGNLSLATTFRRYPRISARNGGRETIQDRINGCMMRSMNGRALAVDSREMQAMVEYLRFLADQDDGTSVARKKAPVLTAFRPPDRAADLKNGAQVFSQRCSSCHGKDGAGLPASADKAKGYILPPLWGSNSFNDGAGMHRVLTAATFIKSRMPLGNANLNDSEAFDVAAFINSRPRPHMEGLDRDYPDRRKKPVDTAYGPYADSFTIEQHSFGPFGPIEAFYKSAK